MMSSVMAGERGEESRMCLLVSLAEGVIGSASGVDHGLVNLDRADRDGGYPAPPAIFLFCVQAIIRALEDAHLLNLSAG